MLTEFVRLLWYAKPVSWLRRPRSTCPVTQNAAPPRHVFTKPRTKTIADLCSRLKQSLAPWPHTLPALPPSDAFSRRHVFPGSTATTTSQFTASEASIKQEGYSQKTISCHPAVHSSEIWSPSVQWILTLPCDQGYWKNQFDTRLKKFSGADFEIFSIQNFKRVFDIYVMPRFLTILDPIFGISGIF